MKIKKIHWTVLHAVNWLQPRGQSGPTATQVADLTGLEVVAIMKAIAEMCAPTWGGEDGPWLSRIRDRYGIAGTQRDDLNTGGYAALYEASANPAIRPDNMTAWVAEVLTGMTEGGGQSKIKSAVIGTGRQPHSVRDPEAAAQKAGEKFAVHIDPEKYKICPGCKLLCKAEDLRADGKICKKCNKLRTYQYRQRNRVEK